MFSLVNRHMSNCVLAWPSPSGSGHYVLLAARGSDINSLRTEGQVWALLAGVRAGAQTALSQQICLVKGQNSKYFQLHRPHGLSQPLNSALVAQKQP